MDRIYRILTVLPDIGGEGLGALSPGVEGVENGLHGATAVRRPLHRGIVEVRMLLVWVLLRRRPPGGLLVVGVGGRRRRRAHVLGSPLLCGWVGGGGGGIWAGLAFPMVVAHGYDALGICSIQKEKCLDMCMGREEMLIVNELSVFIYFC